MKKNQVGLTLIVLKSLRQNHKKQFRIQKKNILFQYLYDQQNKINDLKMNNESKNKKTLQMFQNINSFIRKRIFKRGMNSTAYIAYPEITKKIKKI